MSSPAERAWKSDRRRGFCDIVVMEFLRDELHHKVPTEWKLSVIALGTGIAEPRVSLALRNLVQWGYLRDYRKTKADPRLLTIVRDMADEHAA